MKITDEAGKMITSLLEEYGVNGLRVDVQEGGCCGPVPVIGLDQIEGPAQTINGILVDIPQEYQNLVEDVVLDVQDGNVVVMNVQESGCCGCSGCH